MPRLRATPEQMKDRALVQMIQFYQVERGMNGTEKIAKALGVSKTTANSRLKNPGEMSVDELRRLRGSLSIPIESMLDYLRRAL